MDYLKDDAKAGEFFDRAIADFNGDVSKWSVYFFKGALEFNRGNLLQAREKFEKSLYYNPKFLLARNELKEVEKMLKEKNGGE
jgi:tetratricopeptide (TPR) repeat protein